MRVTHSSFMSSINLPTTLPFIGEWWNTSVYNVENQALSYGGEPNILNAFTINGQPGDLYSCSSEGTYKVKVVQGETYLLRIINAAMNTQLFFKIANHTMTVVAVDTCYTSPMVTDTIVIAPGQTVDALLTADQQLASYYMAAHAYDSVGALYDSTNTTGIILYENSTSSTPLMPTLPDFDDTSLAFQFYSNLTSLMSGPYWEPVPLTIVKHMFVTEGLGLVPCESNATCKGPSGLAFAASMNNESFEIPTKLSMLQPFFYNISGIYTTDFPSDPPLVFDYTNSSNSLNTSLVMTTKSTRATMMKYNSTVQIVFQNTAFVGKENHPIHLHGFNFYVLAQGFGNYDSVTGPELFNLVNPQKRNTIGVPVGGWAVIRFVANNPMASAEIVEHSFYVQNITMNRLCKQQVINAVNGSLPGPTIQVHEGDTVIIHVFNKCPYNLTIHWHGIFQLHSAWADGPEYVTQCPILPGNKYTYKFTITGQEGTLWWHAHAQWLRSTVHGALIIRPRKGYTYPFPKPFEEFPILLGEWWNANIIEIEEQALADGRGPNISNAFTINGWLGDLYNCSSTGTYKLKVVRGETYLLRIINVALNNELFFKIANHTMTVVAVDACYTNPMVTNTIVIGPGQTIDVLLTADQPLASYYMAAHSYDSLGMAYDKTTTRGIIMYENASLSISPMPDLPAFNDTPTAFEFFSSLTSLVNGPHWAPVPLKVDEHMFVTEGLGMVPCGANNTCGAPLGLQFAASMNNESFELPTKLSMLEAFYYNLTAGIYTADFPKYPPVVFDYTNTSNALNTALIMTPRSTKVTKLKYNSTVQIVFQNTALVGKQSHPIHLHGFNFYVLAQGFGNYDPVTGPKMFNLVNPQIRNTVGVPVGGWTIIRFTANNPGVSRRRQLGAAARDGVRSEKVVSDFAYMAHPMLLLLAFALALLAYSSVASAEIVEHSFHVQDLSMSRLCKQQIITIVNGSLPGPTILVHEGDTLIIHVFNKSPYNLTIHWSVLPLPHFSITRTPLSVHNITHGIFQLHSVWADGPEYVTQCPILPGNKYTYRFTITGQEGTLWWHAHAQWLRATVHGALIIRPRKGYSYPFPKPFEEFPILLGEWWNANIIEIEEQALADGHGPNISNAFTINGWPGDLYNCSSTGTYKLKVVQGETYLLRIINVALYSELFFKIANHKMTIVAVDACYTNPMVTDIIVISPGQTIDVLLTANQPLASYYMAAHCYDSLGDAYDATTTTGIITYENATPSSPLMPNLPAVDDTSAAFEFFSSLTSLVNGPHWAPVPLKIDEQMLVTEGLGLVPCGANNTCGAPLGLAFAASMNNESFELPTKLSMLEAFYYNLTAGIYTTDFPKYPPVVFDYTSLSNNLNKALVMTSRSTKVTKLKYNSTVQIVFQNTALVGQQSHPIHLHGFNFYVLAQGFGNYDPVRGPKMFNLVNPQIRNTIGVPVGGWTVIRFTANNPGMFSLLYLLAR
ncbi:hypothetical protein RHGRI_015361 [Rhododendron griersonianum]|uniref:Laccase n=1 Tax=Rhododendron griersonianum TaxID=479676 RepID=A0AAV6KCY8_9ERIC|nr:hypothetical protein RHGRI_015361 [Rhododendron griersonianum]